MPTRTSREVVPADWPVAEAHKLASELGSRTAREPRGNAVGVATAIAFMAFLIVDALAGQRTAAIVFLGVLVGVMGLFAVGVLMLALADRRRREHSEELLAIAVLAARIARGEEPAGEASVGSRTDRNPVEKATTAESARVDHARVDTTDAG